MFQFPGFPTYAYFIQRTFLDSSSRGLPHSEIRGSKLIYSFPRLIAVSHVLLRLPVPRHSPYALIRLNFFFQFSLAFDSYQFFRICLLKSRLKQNCFFTLTEKPFICFSLCNQLSSIAVFSVTFLVFFSLFGFQRSFAESLTPCQHRPIFPSRLQLSIFGTEQLNFRVRYGYGWTLSV